MNSWLFDIADPPVVRLSKVKSRRFDLIDRGFRCPVCGASVSSIALHAGLKPDPDHLALFVMES